MPLGARQEFVEREDLWFIEVPAVELEGLVLRCMNSGRSAQLVELPEDQEGPRAYQPCRLTRFGAPFIGVGEALSNGIDRQVDGLLKLCHASGEIRGRW